MFIYTCNINVTTIMVFITSQSLCLCFGFFTFTGSQIVDHVARPEEISILEQFQLDCACQRVESEALIYIAGYAAHRFRSKFLNLGVLTKELPPPDDWLSCISEGNCMYPSADLQRAALIMNDEFAIFHGNTFSRQSRIFDKLTDIVCAKISVNIPKCVIACLVRTRTYIRLRNLNIRIKRHNRERSAVKKRKHITNII